MMYFENDLKKIRRARQRPFDGYYNTQEDCRLNAAKAAAFLGVTPEAVHNYRKSCFYLPEGRLPSKLMKRPGRPGMWEHTFLKTDLVRLRTAIQNALRDGTLKGCWKDGQEIADLHGITNLGERIRVNAILREWGDNQIIGAQRVVKELGGKPKRVWIYDVDELDRCLAGRTILEAAAEPEPVHDISQEPSSRLGDQQNGQAAINWQETGDVRIGGFGDPVWVNGKPKKLKSYSAFKVVEALIKAGREGLDKDELEAVNSAARRILKNLRKDPDWSAVVHMAEVKGQHYWIG